MRATEETRNCARCAHPIPDGRHGLQRYCSRNCRQRAYETRVQNSKIDQEASIVATPVTIHRCAECKASIIGGEKPPTGWRYGIDRLLRCYPCTSTRLTRICLKHGYPVRP